MSTEYSATVAEILASTKERTGVIWSLQESRDLNVNLVQFAEGEGVGEHLNDEVDVLLVGVSGFGEVRINGTLHCLSSGTLILIPKGAQRSTRGISADFAYLDDPPATRPVEDPCTKTRSRVSNEKRREMHAHTGSW